ncbi:hypothetical protein SARC_12110 [Sphaeroforma arctica JP610]|uniref:TLC domain-containing protein n=1 Tax=Sphaeroforma arctica JP610 TaxID=667725 RepID=A0A0L0FF32_9EUKA|nr:hypothetical protein SARC_12110 [Sphaeroforma arctica JP610]KNC75365.1 hypothetical protein SARC_12110 [Sphaeroforma arctica JP610]|eukprot:XP_014149267.1 hypothetical protein SARC_12110 [Sphaeroforma arctica JP610]
MNDTFDPYGVLTEPIVKLVFVLVNAFTTVSWIAIKYLLDRLWPSFKAINPPHKKWYVVANISKACCLGVTVVSCSWWYYAYHAYIVQERDLSATVMYLVKFSGATYIANHALVNTDQVHHYVSTTLFFLVAIYDLNHADIVHMINIYAFFSTLAFTTNLFLALRVMYAKTHPTVMRGLAMWSFVVYLAACTGNWILQGWWLLRHVIDLRLSIPALFYMLFLALVINDDIVLLRWLYQAGFETQDTSATTKKKQ